MTSPHPLAYAPVAPPRVAVHTPAGLAWHPCTALLTCRDCGLVMGGGARLRSCSGRNLHPRYPHLPHV